MDTPLPGKEEKYYFNDPSGYLRCALDYEGGGAIAIPLVSGGLKDCLKGLGYGAIGTIKAIGAATVGVTVKAIASNERSKKQHAVYAVRNKGKVIYIGRTIAACRIEK